MINADVVGYGYAGRAFQAYLTGLEPRIRLHPLSTRSPNAQAASAADHPEAVIYPLIDALVVDEAVRLVIIATPHDTHRELDCHPPEDRRSPARRCRPGRDARPERWCT